MRSVVFAIALLACTPDAENYPIQPGSVVPLIGQSQEGSDDDDGGGGDDDGVDLDAGLPFFDAGAVNDAGAFLDGPPPDAAALLPDAGTPFP